MSKLSSLWSVCSLRFVDWVSSHNRLIAQKITPPCVAVGQPEGAQFTDRVIGAY